MWPLTDIIFPKFCCGCDKLGTFLCYKCYEKISFLNFPPSLSKHESIDQVLVAAEFSFPVDNLIKTLKYQSVGAIGLTCARLLYHSVNIPKVEIITAVPLHPKRQKERRFNQAEVIAQELARLVNKPYLPLLIRKKYTQNLASIPDKKIRASLIAGSFSLNPQLKPYSFTTALVVDDVVTSGSTLDESAKVLKNNGFSQVFGLAVAHGN